MGHHDRLQNIVRKTDLGVNEKLGTMGLAPAQKIA
jgi:hypothetical protein